MRGDLMEVYKMVTGVTGVKILQPVYRGFDGDSVENQDVQNCTVPLCLPDSQCSYHSAIVQSPNYPSTYPADRDIYWFLKLTTNISVDAVVITVDDFHLEEDRDWVNIGVQNHLDTRTVRETLTGTLKRGQTFRIPFSFGFQIYVHFHSDSSVQYNGFRFRYTVVPRDPQRVQILKPTPSSVLLRWDSLVSTPTDNVTYKVYHGLLGEQTTLTGVQLVTGTREYNLTGLMASTSYFVYVVALVSCGQEGIGHLVNFTTVSNGPGDVLHQWVKLRVTQVECGTVFMSWTTSKTVSSRVTGYLVRTVTDAGTQVKATQRRYVTLRDLKAELDYNITTTAVTDQGEGPVSNQVTIQLQRCEPGETAPSLTPVLASELRYNIRSRSLLIQLPPSLLLDRIALLLGQTLTVWVLTVEGAAGMGLAPEDVPDAQDATHGQTDVGGSGVYVAHCHRWCHLSPVLPDPLSSLGIFQLGGGEACPPARACNGPLHSNTTYRVRYVLMGNGTPVFFSQWSEPLTTSTVLPHQEIQDGRRALSPSTVTVCSLLATLCLLLSLCVLGVSTWRYNRTKRRWLVWRSFVLGCLNPIHLSGAGTAHGEIAADSSTPGYEEGTPWH
ncbi:uncharacterized protein [Mobula birostris]|uniref:uncharacterized protein isoform X1 n=1 Tax=Mobula birostris TaxID=1983395 RepID=UPI003B27EAF5